MDFYRYTRPPLPQKESCARIYARLSPLVFILFYDQRTGVRTAQRPKLEDSSLASRLLTDAVEQAHEPYDGVIGAGRRDRSRVRNGHGPA